VGDSYARSAPVLTRIAEEGDVLKIYSAYFDYPVWRGHLKAYHILLDGNIGDLVSEWASDCDGDGNFDGDAGCEIKTDGRGTVYTTSAGSRIEFSTSNLATLKPLVNPDAEDIDGNGTANEDADATAVINYTLDSGHDSSKYVGTRDPNWPLGDIYNSGPVIVTNPNLPITYWAGYSAFKTAHASRPTVIYVGANDGMLHAINEINGKERWAYIPNCVLGTLHEFKEGHRFTVDLSIKGADIDTSAGCAGTGWKTVVVSGLRKGGNHYYALDVTDPDDPQPMWEMTSDKMGKTWSIPAFGRININGTTTSVVFVGGGYSTDSSVGNRVYILKAADGSILKEFTVGGSINNIPSEILAVRYLLDEESRPVDYITRALVDPDLKGNIEVAYFGDTGGTLWKIKDLNADSGWNPTLEEFYTPENPRPIYHRPAIADVYHDCTRRFVLFGTGNENDPIDANSYDYFYEIEDREFDNSAGGPDEGSTWTGAQIADGLFRMTWMKTLPQGEKVFSNPATYLNVVYFTTYQPQGGCAMGFSYLYGLTTTLCGTEGGEAGLEYGLDDTPLDPYEEKIDLGRSIASSPTLGPPRLYIQKPGGGGEGLGPPVAIKIPTPGGKLLYWRES
jgi:Tfp pilus tip-associated adhesin PilY1